MGVESQVRNGIFAIVRGFEIAVAFEFEIKRQRVAVVVVVIDDQNAGALSYQLKLVHRVVRIECK